MAIADDIMKVFQEGWPVASSEMKRPELQKYFTFRDELMVQDGLIFKGKRLEVPSKQEKRWFRECTRAI